MGGLESVITGIIDEFPNFFRKFKWHREIFTGVVVFVSFLFALASVTSVSVYVILFLNNKGA